jgi:PAS domain S-box-containing protein
MRRLLDRAVSASSNGIVITDPQSPDDPIVYVNPAFEKISGYPMDEVLGHNCRFLQGEDRDQPALGELRAALKEERESRVVLKNYRKDGTPFWNELYVSPVHDEEGRLTNFVGVQNDITERRRIEEVLRESEERFRATFEHAAIGAAQVGIDGRWLRVNRRLGEIVGYEPEELLKTTFQDITHPDDLEGDLAQVRRLLADELQTYTMEKRYLRKDGSAVWVNLTVSLVRNASGEPAYFIAAVEDISKRKKT